MRARVFVILIVLLGGTCFAQNFIPNKDLAFGQIAAGGGYESVLTVTNRGTTAYSGLLELYTGNGQPWFDVMINGLPILSGIELITLNPGETKTYRITISGAVQSAYGFIRANDASQTSFIEGNLTYFVSAAEPVEGLSPESQPSFANGNSLPHEGVGVPPSVEFFKTTIPFEDFLTLALALVNANVGPDANVKLTVFDNTGLQKDAVTVPIGPFWHYVKFLWQEFPGLTLGAGRLDIESDRPIFGTALLFVPGASGDIFSSLPLLPAPYSYSFSTAIGQGPIEGEMSLWAEGGFIKGLIAIPNAGGQSQTETFQIQGQFQSGGVVLIGYGTSIALAGDNEPFGMLIIFENFSFSMANVPGFFTVGDIQTGESDTQAINLTKIF